MNTKTSLSKTTSLLALGCATALISQSAQAAFHLWTIRELYTNLDGTQQFIELFCPSAGQTLIGGQTIQVVEQATSTTHTFTIPANLGSDTTNHAYLLSTATLQAAGAPAPNAVIPNNFLFKGASTINFFGTPNANPYTALPTDGVTSRALPGGTNQVNSPQNFAGQTGQVVVPEPTTWAMIGMGGVGLCALLRRRQG